VPDHVVLVLNAGSSSLKYRVIQQPGDDRLLGDTIQRVERDGFEAAFDQVVQDVEAAGLAGRLTGLGHRVVHGGTRHTQPVRVDGGLIADVEDLARLAPLHNPPAVAGMRHARAAYPDVPQLAVFDTAYFADLPAHAATYAIDREVAAAEDVRRYGMHGISHEYVAHLAAETVGEDVANLAQVVLHLGNGASAAAIRAGRPVDTSMGFTPLEGLVMGTRAGDLDSGILLHLQRHASYDVDRLDELLNRRSGLLGLSGTSDFRDLMTAVHKGDASARLAYDVYCHRIRKYVGAYLAVLGGADAITFTGGVGENGTRLREDSLAGLERLGVAIDPARNRADVDGPRVISSDESTVTVLVVPTDEELAIARVVSRVLG
jgi:acetate kinase